MFIKSNKSVLKPFRQPLHKRYFLKCSAASESTPETEQTHKTKQSEDLMERVKQYEPGVARFTEQQLDSKMNADVVSEKVQSLLKKKGHTVETVDAKISMFLLLQKGAILKKMDPSYKVLVGQTDKGTERPVYLTVGTLKDAFKKCGLSGKLRQFAAKYATEIASVAGAISTPGFLSNSLQRLPLAEGKKFPSEHKHWMADFQVNNPDCPEEVKALFEQLSERKRSQSKANAETTKTVMKKTSQAKKKAKKNTGRKKKSGK